MLVLFTTRHIKGTKKWAQIFVLKFECYNNFSIVLTTETFITNEISIESVSIITNRGLDAENDLFLEKASKIVNIQFADFPEFTASWLVKATWVNMTLFGATSKVKYMFLCFESFNELSIKSFRKQYLKGFSCHFGHMFFFSLFTTLWYIKHF